MAKRRFWVDLACEIEIDDEVIAAVDDGWRKHFYKLDDFIFIYLFNNFLDRFPIESGSSGLYRS